MQRILSVVVLCVAATGVLVLLIPTGQAEEKSGKSASSLKFQRVAPIEVLMEVIDDMYLEIEEDLDEQPAKFKKARKKALVLAEISNVVRFGQLKDPAANKKWVGFAEKLRGEFLEMARASEAKKGTEVKALWSKAEGTCESCHDAFEDDYEDPVAKK